MLIGRSHLKIGTEHILIIATSHDKHRVVTCDHQDLVGGGHRRLLSSLSSVVCATQDTSSRNVARLDSL